MSKPLGIDLPTLCLYQHMLGVAVIKHNALHTTVVILCRSLGAFVQSQDGAADVDCRSTVGVTYINLLCAASGCTK
jgi:hypothetical protein